MRYRVKKDNRIGLEQGTILYYDAGIDDIVFNGVVNKWFIGDQPLENSDWFEPVEQVQEGDWVFIDTNKNKWLIKVTNNDGLKYDGYGFKNDEWFGDLDNGLFSDYSRYDYRPATDDEVEQALIKEAKRRGFEPGATANCGNLYDDDESYTNYTLSDDRHFRYDSNRDTLWREKRYQKWPVYTEGKWAEIIEDEWEAVHRTEDHSFVHSENMVIDMKGKRSMSKQEATAIAEALNNLDSND